METLFQRIKDLPDQELEIDLRSKIKRRIFILKFKKYIFLSLALLLSNFLFLSFRIYLKTSESEALTIIKVFLQDFEMSFDYLGSFLSSLVEILPQTHIMIWTLNLILLIASSKIVYSHRRDVFKI